MPSQPSPDLNANLISTLSWYESIGANDGRNEFYGPLNLQGIAKLLQYPLAKFHILANLRRLNCELAKN